MNSKIKATVLIGCVIGAGFLVTSCAPKTFSDRVDWGTTAASSYMDLTDDQEPALVQIADTIKEAYPVFKTMRADVQSTLRQELEKETFDAERVDTQLNEIKNNVLGLSDELVDEFAIFYDGLNSEQRAIIAEHKRGDKGHGFSGFHGRGHWGKGWRDKRGHRSMMKDFDLQPEQAVVLKKIVAGFASDSVDLIMIKSSLKKMLKAEFAAETFDADKIKTEVRSAILTVFDSIDRQVPNYKELHELFTEEQRQILVERVDLWIERSEEQD